MDVPLPALMADLPKDRRGFPIPAIVARDNAGGPLFTINNDETVSRFLSESRCGVCGNELEYGDLWWVGGPLSAFHLNGCYRDGPMHCECSTYALQVCPHLAAPLYTKSLGALPAMKNGVPFAVLQDSTMLPDRPIVFVQGQSVSFDMDYPRVPQGKLHPVSGPDPRNLPNMPRAVKFSHYEVWQFGDIIEDEKEGLRLIRQAFEDMDRQTTQAPKLIVPPRPTLEIS